jgi:lysyl endopeptidase
MTQRNRLILFFICCAHAAMAQISQGGLPYALSRPEIALQQTVPVLQLPPLDVEKALAEDTKKQGLQRFAAPLAPVNIDLNNAGAWMTLNNGDRLWQCRIQSEGALGLFLKFNRFSLPAGARLYAYTPDGKHIEGAYTRESCLPNGKFLLGLLPGSTACLEYYEPADVQGQGDIQLVRVDYAYDANAMQAPEVQMMGPFGTSLSCNVNVNCPAGANWQTEKKGVARIVMVFQLGIGYCSGSLIANTAGTFDPYFLSAHHCQLLSTNPEFEVWRFDFDYEGVGCNNPATEPSTKQVLGCERIAFRAETDFMLLKLNPIPLNYGVYYNGWNRSTTPSSNSAFIHHPVGDIKKISIDTNATTLHPNTINWGGQYGSSPPNTHWRTLPDIGIYQEGSSGSVLLDQNKRIVGQLHGGNYNNINPCLITNCFWGRFDLSWSTGTNSGTRLKEWLDPGNTNAMTQNGYAQPVPAGFTLSGNIKTWWDDTPMANVSIYLSGTITDTTQTDTLGNFQFLDVPGGGNYTVTPVRDTNAINGVSTFDLSLTSKQILGIQPLDSPWKIIAADVNKSNSITNFDILESRRMILGVTTNYSASRSWRFYPAFISFSNPLNPFANSLPEIININNLSGPFPNINFKAVKIGDVNTNADPGN